MQKIKTLCIAQNIRADVKMELKMMLADLLPVCPVESPDFNMRAIAWIEKNACGFRKKWERYHNGNKECIVGN
jgi:hypothetical protein